MADHGPSSFYDDRDGRWYHTFHQSGLAEVDMCPERGRAGLAAELPREENDAMVLGTCVHSAIEYMLDDDADLIEGLRVFENELDTYPEFEHVKWTNRHAMFDVGHTMLDTWDREVRPRLGEAHLIEWEFSYPIVEDDERVITLAGTADFIDATGHIIDWKTGEAKYQQWEKQRWAIQPTVYTWALNQLYPEMKAPFSFQFCLLRPSGKVDWCEVHRSQADFAWLRKKVLHLARTVEAELDEWPLNDTGWWCSSKWCAKWDQCKGSIVKAGWDQTIKK